MDEPRGRLRLLLCVFAASLLLQARLGVSQTLAFDDRVDTSDEVGLNCLGGPLGTDLQAATFMFRHPITGEILRTINTTSGQTTLTIPVLPENETVVSCTTMGESTESQRIAIAGKLLFPPPTHPLTFIASWKRLLIIYFVCFEI